MIQWNHITWYSKAIALAVFVVVSLGGFWFGLEVGYLKGYVNGARTAAWEPTQAGSASDTTYYKNVAEWQTNQDTSGGFLIAYPIDFDTAENNFSAAGGNLSILSNGMPPLPGKIYFTLAIPKAFEPQTNFDDARLLVGGSRDTTVVAQCLNPAYLGEEMSSSTVSINGVPFVIFHTSDAGAGNYYEITSYRTVHAGQCYAAEYTIHSSQIANYPAEYGLKPFDKAKLTDVLDRIVSTFKFL
jgi:hypothetical protein